MKHLRVVLPLKILLAFTASFLLWMGALFPVQAQSTLPQGTCTLAVHGIALTITVNGANAELLCEAALHDPAVTKAAEPLGGYYETHRKPHGRVWCKRSFSGFTVTIRSSAPALGKLACKSFTSA
jgi:hypothetical protein